jgi:hypothetical protein
LIILANAIFGDEDKMKKVEGKFMVKCLLAGLKKLVGVWLVSILMVLMFGCGDKSSEEEKEYKNLSSELEGVFIDYSGSYLCEAKNGWFTVYKVQGPYVDFDEKIILAEPYLKFVIEGTYKQDKYNSLDRINFIPVSMVIDYEIVCSVLIEFNLDLKENERFISYVCGIEVDIAKIWQDSDFYKCNIYEEKNISLDRVSIPNRLLTENVIKWYMDQYLSIAENKKEEFFRRITSGFFESASMDIFDFRYDFKYNSDYINEGLKITTGNGSFELNLKFIVYPPGNLKTYQPTSSSMWFVLTMYWISEEDNEIDFSSKEMYREDFEQDLKFEGWAQGYYFGEPVIEVNGIFYKYNDVYK